MYERKKAVARRVIEEFLNTGDPEAADVLFAPDYTDHSASHPELGGLENIKKAVGEWRDAFPDSRSTIGHVVAEDDVVAVRWTTSATHAGQYLGVAPTGRRIEVMAMGMFRIVDGKVVESWDVSFDASGLLQQLAAGQIPVTPNEVLGFWFGREDEPGFGEFREAWFQKNPDFDEQVRTRFLQTYEKAAAGEHDAWMEDGRGATALTVVLDQFSRNMFRGDARTHAADAKAREVSRHAQEHALDRELPPVLRMFLYMPFMHSEELADQRLSVELFGLLAQEPGAKDVTEFARRHLEIVERFGRFPHRNAILGRETTPEEAEFLTEPGSSF